MLLEIEERFRKYLNSGILGKREKRRERWWVNIVLFEFLVLVNGKEGVRWYEVCVFESKDPRNFLET